MKLNVSQTDRQIDRKTDHSSWDAEGVVVVDRVGVVRHGVQVVAQKRFDCSILLSDCTLRRRSSGPANRAE